MIQKVLFADDSPAMRTLIEATLRKHKGLQLRQTVDGEEALLVAREWQPDLVLLDVVMSRINGFELCHILK